jgi:hypothetical protein
MRTRGSSVGLSALVLLISLVSWSSMAAAEGLSTDYRKQETTRCSYAQGCPRMVRNAVSYAKEFCQGEGGVRSGASNRDFKCEQRGIYCTVLGRITCMGRFDPNMAGRAPSQGRLSTIATGTTCLDADCSRFIDHAPGNREQGVHACPKEYGMIGLSRPRADIVCHALEHEEREALIDTTTVRDDMRSCPLGTYLRGLSDNRDLLLCARSDAVVGPEVVQREPLTHGLQVCDEVDGEPRFMTGLDIELAGLRCAPVE